MSTVCVEVVHWKAYEKYINDPSSVDPGVSLLRQAGAKKSWSGLQVESPRLYMVISWESREQHQEAAKNENIYGPLKKLISELADPSDIRMIHVNVPVAECEKVHSSPVTEFATLSLKTGVTYEEGVASLQKLITDVIEPNAIANVWSKVMENENDILLIIGWTSVQAHTDAISTGKGPVSIADLKSKFDVNVIHVPLKAH